MTKRTEMLLIKFLGVLLLATMAYGQNEACTYKKYFVGSCDGDWHTAFAACSLHGMELAVIDSNKAEREVEQALNSCKPKRGINQGFWIGAYRVGEPGKWTWLNTGTETKFTKWGPGEPNNYGGRERCVEIYRDNRTLSYFWNDLPCDEGRVGKRYVCQNKKCYNC